ncbi:MAG TPA: signal recognition particle receptor subunit alpha, partial [Myxococcota bacterium]|nr:signal recognition particle receptor subunit alpha [Myxococcota bacterium]
MQEAQILAPLLEPLVPFFAWMAEHPAAAIGAIAAVPLALTAAVLVFGRRPEAPPEPEEIGEPIAPGELPAERAAALEVSPPAPAAPELARRQPTPIPVPPEPAPVAPPAPAPPPPVEAPAPPRPARLADRLARTRTALVGGLGRLLAGRRVEGDVLEELEALLFGADLGVRTTESLLEAVRG